MKIREIHRSRRCWQHSWFK